MSEDQIIAAAQPEALSHLSESHQAAMFDLRDSLMARLPVKDALLYAFAAGMAFQRSQSAEFEVTAEDLLRMVRP